MIRSSLCCCIIATAVALGATMPAAAASRGVFLPNTISVNRQQHTAVLPVHKGSARSTTVWYIVTDASDVGVAKTLGVVYSPDIASIGAAATQNAKIVNGELRFDGTPDFRPTRVYVASKGGFPPASFQPGAVADAAYSPFVHVQGWPGIINASIVATGDGPYDVTEHTNTADHLIAINTAAQTGTFALTRGFANDMPVLYLSTEASVALPSALERAIYTPKLAKARASATIPIGVVASGPMNSNPQGLAYLALDTPLGQDVTAANADTIGSPFNILSLVPSLSSPYAQNGYSPLWSVEVVRKTQTRLTNFAQVAASRPQMPGFLINCPVVALQ
jgi:hypothetical protein